MGRFWVAGGVLAVVFALLPEAARADSCGQRTSPPLVTVRTQIRPHSYDLNRGILELSSDRNLAVPRGLEEFKYAVGVTAVEAKGQTQWDLHGRPRGGGGYCWSVANVRIVITALTKVYIAKEVIRGSCLWKEVRAHEAKHVKMDQKLIPRLPDVVRPSVVRQVSRSLPAQSQTEANARWSEIISKSIGDAVQAFRAQRDKAQLTIDTREEYSRASRICGNAEISAAFARAGIK